MNTRSGVSCEGKIYRNTMYLAGMERSGMMQENESNWGISVEEETV